MLILTNIPFFFEKNMQKPEIPNIPPFRAPNGRVWFNGFGSRIWAILQRPNRRLVRESSPKTVIFVPEECVNFCAPKCHHFSTDSQKIHNGHVFGEIIGVWFWNGCHSTCHVHHPEKKACGQLRSPEGAAVLLESWIESGFWNSKQLVLNLPVLVVGGDWMFTCLPWIF